LKLVKAGHSALQNTGVTHHLEMPEVYHYFNESPR